MITNKAREWLGLSKTSVHCGLKKKTVWFKLRTAKEEAENDGRSDRMLLESHIVEVHSLEPEQSLTDIKYDVRYWSYISPDFQSNYTKVYSFDSLKKTFHLIFMLEFVAILNSDTIIIFSFTENVFQS